jgi:hypothetical protein
MRRVLAGALVAAVSALVIAACGGSSTGPTPPPPPPPVNNPPQIKSITLSDGRAEVGTAITATAVVEDQETPVANLTYAWTADAGTFAGTGAVVTWLPPAGAKTPADYVLTLTVTERYTSGSTVAENKTSSTASVHVNDSLKELADLSVRFLNNFAISSVSPETCVSEFSDACGAGKKDELSNIRENRHDFLILASTIRPTSVQLPPARLTATVHTFCAFTSRVITTQPQTGGCQVAGACPFNSVQPVQGDCWTTNVYDQGRWWLCESHFTPQGALTDFGRAFFGIRSPSSP